MKERKKQETAETLRTERENEVLESGTNGIYVRNDTINDPYPIYYYRGAVDNNLIFAGFCWKIVRTTETGGVKLIYNGNIVNSFISCNTLASEINFCVIKQISQYFLKLFI